MRKPSLLFIVFLAVAQSVVGAETFTGIAAASGTFKRPLVDVEGVRYELQAAENAGPSVKEALARFSKGEKGTYSIEGLRSTVQGNDAIIVESITAVRTTQPIVRVAKPPGYIIHDHAQREHKFRLVIPDNLDVVRGILVVGPYSGGDSRDYHQQAWYREFLKLHGFAFLGATNYYLHDYSVMRDAIKHFSIATGHPELVNAPYAATGFSAGGGYTRKLMWAEPEKVIAGVVVGSTMKLGGKLTDDHRRVPMCVINGENEREPGEGPGMAKHLEPVLAEQRLKGALWSWMAVKGVGHEFAGQEVLSMPILDAAVRMRYPADGDTRKGPVRLKPIGLDSGWIADNTTWSGGLTAIVPVRDFKGDVSKSSWLLNEDVAFIYRAYSTLDRPLKITSPDPMNARSEVLDIGGSVTITVDSSGFAGWEKMELFDGAQKVDSASRSTMPPGGVIKFTIKDLKKGYHVFSVIGTCVNEKARPSNPVLVVVR